MPSRRAPRLPAALAVLGVAAALLAGCTGDPEPAAAPNAPAASSTAATTSSSEVAPAAGSITITPADAAADVPPGDPVTVTAAGGTLADVTVTNPAGEPVAGELSADGTSWTTTEDLGYGKTYAVTASGTGGDGGALTATSRFTTVQPAALAFPAMNPLDGDVVGVGQPLAVYFDQPVTDRQAAQDAITVTADPPTEGGFSWFSDSEVHWRPAEYWAPGTSVTVDVAVYGKDLGDGVYGQEDRRIGFTIGDSVIARADGATHQMTVEVNGAVVRTMPISLGSPEFPSNNGVHVVTERHETKVMDSTTYGLPLDQGGYRTEVQWATRISNSGEFVHAAPWSVAQQGNSNVSHGCINLSTENAKWFYDTVKKGDVVVIIGSGGPDLEPWNGFGDWQIPASEWIPD